VSGLLVYVKSLKGLAAIRDSVWDLLSTESISQHWGAVCQRLLERPLAVWEDFLQQLFLQRLQVGASCASCWISHGGRELTVPSSPRPSPKKKLKPSPPAPSSSSPRR